MSANPNEFRRAVVENVAKRAAHRCSNPDCSTITTGPAEGDDRSLTIGEAAHIYGANPGAARYDLKMAPAERSAITNAIWLCRNCHKLIDADPGYYMADLLFEWRLEHERHINEQIGKTGERLRQKVVLAQMEEFANTSYLARQIVIDRPNAWEYRLTAELLRTKLEPVQFRWRALQAGLYTKPVVIVSEGNVWKWLEGCLTEMGGFIPALCEVINTEFTTAWGAPGESGSPIAILRTCELFEEACQQLLAWEEKIRFAMLPEEFNEMKNLLCGTGGRVIGQVAEIPAQMAQIFSNDVVDGTHSIEITINLPDGWQERCEEAIATLVSRYGSV